VFGIVAVKGAKCVGMLLYWEQIGCELPAVKGSNWVWDCCCKVSKMCGRAAVQEANLLWDC